MVLGYQCPEHGVHSECDVAESGQRICPDGGPAVTGITGSIRKPDDNGSIHGNIIWSVGIGYGTESGFVEAFDWQEAAQKAIDKYDDVITEVRPRDRRHQKIPGV